MWQGILSALAFTCVHAGSQGQPEGKDGGLSFPRSLLSVCMPMGTCAVFWVPGHTSGFFTLPRGHLFVWSLPAPVAGGSGGAAPTSVTPASAVSDDA